MVQWAGVCFALAVAAGLAGFSGLVNPFTGVAQLAFFGLLSLSGLILAIGVSNDN